MDLKLTKPIVFFDIEATGLDVSNDRIVEISLLKRLPQGGSENRTYRVNPGIPMPAEAFKIHGISDEDLKDEPIFKQIAHELNNFIGSADLGGFNILRYDLPLLVEEFLRADIDFDFSNRKVIDVQKIFHMLEKRTLEAAYQFYCGKNLKDAHTAEADTMATWEVLLAQLERYEQLEETVEHLYQFTGAPIHTMVDTAGRIVRNKKGVELFNFGKYKGKPVEEVLQKDPNYYNWIMDNNFSNHTKKKLTEIKIRQSQNGG